MFKQRMMGIIFATDMSRHLADMKEINQLMLDLIGQNDIFSNLYNF
jgi:hypothetical protein